MPVKRLIVNLRWPVYLAVIFFAARWVFEANSNEAWVALIAAVSVLLADIAVQLTSNTTASSSASRYVGKLRSRLETHPGIRNYVPLQIADQSPKVSVSSIDELNGLTRCIILGSPDVGKSTVLRRLALEAVREWQADPEHSLLPIWLEMGHWRKGSLKRFLRRSTGLPGQAFKEFNLALYLDDLDRLTPKRVAQLRQWFQQPADRPVRVIGTCRSSAVSDLEIPFDTVELSDALTNGQIDQFIQSYLGSRAEPLRSVLLLHALDVDQMKRLATDFPQAKDPVLLLRTLTAKSSLGVDPDDPSPNPYQDLIGRAGFLASLLLNFQSFPVVATPFNVSAVVHTVLTHVWQRHSLDFPEETSSWGDAVRISASLAHTMRSWRSSHNAIQEPVTLDYVVHYNRLMGIRVAEVHRLAYHLILAGIWQLDPTEGTVYFTNRLFFEYFLAWSVDRTWLQDSLGVPYDDLWNRYSADWDTVVVGLSAITEDPTVLLEMLLKRDVVLAAKCLLSLDWGRLSRDIHGRVVNAVESVMLDPQNANAEDRPVEGAILLFLLSDASAIPKMIQAMQLVRIDRFVERIASLLERFGDLALPALHRFLNTLKPGQDYSTTTFKYVVRTLAHIGNPESVAPLSNIVARMETTEQSQSHPYEILVRAALVHLGETSHKAGIMHHLLHSPDDLLSWYGLAVVSVDFIPDLVTVLTTAAEHPDQYHFNPVAQTFTKTITYQYGAVAYPYLARELVHAQPKAVKTVLLDTLGQLGETTDGSFLISLLQDQDPSVKVYAIEAAGRLRVAQAIPHLISLLDHDVVEFRYEAAGALGQIGNAAAVHALKAHLIDCADASTHPKIRSLRVCDAAASALVNIGTPESKQIALAWCEEIIETQPLQNAYNRTFELLVRIDTPRAFALWNKLHYRLYPSE